MTVRRALVLAGITAIPLVFAPSSAAGPKKQVAGPKEEAAALKAHIDLLASSTLRGRRAWPDREKAAAYIADQLKRAGCTVPPGKTSFFYDQGGSPEQPHMRHVLAWLGGPKGKAADEYIMVAASYDGLGTRQETWYPGADTNASGVAVILETARQLAALERKDWQRAVLFVAFDRRFPAVLGAASYVRDPAFPLKDCAAVIEVESVGRSVGDFIPGTFFVLGTERGRVLADLADSIAPREGSTILHIGLDLQGERSSYSEFMNKKIPGVFVTGGPSFDYMLPKDLPGRIDYKHLVRGLDWVVRFSKAAVRSEARAAWIDEPEPNIEEIRDLRTLAHDILEATKDDKRIPAWARTLVVNFRKNVDLILEKGKVSKQQRDSVVSTVKTFFELLAAVREELKPPKKPAQDPKKPK